MYLAPGTPLPFLVHRAVQLPVCLTAGQEDIWIQHLQKGEPFPSLWIIKVIIPLALQAWGSAENEPDRPPAPSETQHYSGEKNLFLTVTLASICVY